MPGSRCVVQSCSNSSDSRVGISLHYSPVSKGEREKRVRFVKTHRANFTAQGRFMICSDHFENQCFERSVHIEGSRRRLLPLSVPTVWTPSQKRPTSSSRSRRKVMKELLSNSPSDSSIIVEPEEYRNEEVISSTPEAFTTPSLALVDAVVRNEEIISSPPEVLATSSLDLFDHLCATPPATPLSHVNHSIRDKKSSTPNRMSDIVAMDGTVLPCSNCEDLKKEKKRLQRKLRVMEVKLDESNQNNITNQQQWAETFQQLHQKPVLVSSGTQTDATTSGTDDTPEDEDMENGDKEEPNEEQEIENDPYWTPEETDAS